MTVDYRTPKGVIVIGFTGGIASGKSTVTEELEKNGAHILNADHFGHRAYGPCFNALVARFGDKIVNEDGKTINRKALGAIVFADTKDLQALNEIMWPVIKDMIREEIFKVAEEMENANKPNVSKDGKINNLIALEAAVMVEAGWMDLVDEVWVVLADESKQKERLMARNNLDAAEAEKRINSQISNKERAAVAHVTVWNRGSLEDLRAILQKEIQSVKSRYSKLSAFEAIDVVDKDNNVLMQTKRAVATAFKLTCRCTHVVLVHEPSGGIFVQKRSKWKDSYPSTLDPASGGYCNSGEPYEACAVREMREEMGIDLDNKLTFVSPIYFEDTTGSQWAYLYCAKTQKGINDLQVQEEEVEAVTLMKPNEIVQLAKKDPQAFIPDGLFAFNTFMEKTSANM
eukprot:CAMPEP_0204830736 /NCGR_PEP_ID=MMETSP1346-20131115/9189_1 /ASSEMBLY_ACC=CAM_ASM_000771 /TAXON_ID=215587 /ORGANISM="Aplanochytrium stocchinoi, Strain GSBS06" /LENGTH=399 /DNA_ID=CAMNT_0051961239 /DNA_START=135 /DNA_END=1334 /DNA_ORIENTATION=+